MDTTQNLSDWFKRVSQASNRKDVFAVLDEFRTHEWTDEELSQMSRYYMRFISSMAAEKSNDSAGGAEGQPVGEDGPVWYEKM